MKIQRIDEFTRIVRFDDGMVVEVIQGWTRLGGQGWMPKTDLIGQTYRSIREAALAGRRDKSRLRH